MQFRNFRTAFFLFLLKNMIFCRNIICVIFLPWAFIRGICYMRKQIKQNILDIIKTIYDAHDDIKKLLKKGYKESAASLIGDCQDAALSVGNTIIDSEGEEFVTVGLIENYCKDLFGIYNSLDTNDSYDCDSIYKTLNRDLTDIKKSIEKDIRGKIEVVFMPYKASMWDSLESVWKAADADPDCDAYVVPIPYYDRNPDHSFGEFHYEGNEFPDYVPVTHYLKYNEKVRKPDVIYIHNPYDDLNYVTSVDPKFYSFELKKHTKMLIYIPYYVITGKFINKSFINTSAYRFIDRVIVQSKIIMNQYKEVFGKDGDKAIALGSPKFDAVVNSIKTDFVLCDKWKNIIGNKKIILYNTSIAGALDNTNEFLKKLENVFNYFKNSNEYVLWWRPHPLLESTFNSMRNDVYSYYKQIVSDYKEQEYGIYDDTSELHRAIVYSDMYYGDVKSSVATLYCATGKPVVYSNFKNLTEVGNFDEDLNNYYSDNSDFEILRQNENYDGTAGKHIYLYIKNQIK